MTSRRAIILGTLCIALAAAIAVIVLYRNSSKSETQLTFSSHQTLNALWNGYIRDYLEPNTLRTLDKQQNGITTSEGESYTMLRAAWMGDKPTFDASWKWTKDILQHKDDHLFSWLFGKDTDGTYRVLADKGGQNTASDADSDVALSLVFAYARWQDPSYLNEAKAIVSDIWDKEVVTVNGTPYLAADNLEKNASTADIIVNPSYLSPASYRIFAKIDPSHPWNQLADSSYQILNQSMDLTLNATSTAELPPDWIAVNRTTGQMHAAAGQSLDTNFGYDAFRVPWRIALDYQWNKAPAALSALKKMSFLSAQWNASKLLYAGYTHAGSPVAKTEAPAMYGATIGYFMAADPSAADEIYRTKLGYLFDPSTNDWHEPLGYYDSNWAWFGIALYTGGLPNLTEGMTLSR